MTASAHAALDALHIALNSADTQLNHLSVRLQSELGHHDTALSLITAVRRLEKQLPALRQRMLTVYDQKAHLVSGCQRQLQECYSFASRIAPVIDPALKPTDYTADLITAFQNASDTLSHHLPPQPHHLDLNFDRHDSGQSDQSNVATTPANQPSKPSSSSRAKTPPSVPKPNTSSHFDPISKAAYNRLPRNIKIRAGRLPAINAFYQKVFDFMHSQKNSPQSDKKLMVALEQQSMDKFEVLRALAVFTCTKKGWQLTSPSSPKS
ncbi:hypothetical protein BWQ96_00189 [Gracilariopsis chorda]|uniref:Uncharacterized protein n=1 Tax=Gracilariopsis chorda TaxID=448386 RepID=A0A2V3J6K1_9FLOR|nr:hypothetical protein BWQ96_00189 [Gracilariopsis chorda]|eukprot:PXF50029.1 hypothetical protein BWQ96_00189 [Gracilariopsis chorda]